MKRILFLLLAVGFLLTTAFGIGSGTLRAQTETPDFWGVVLFEPKEAVVGDEIWVGVLIFNDGGLGFLGATLYLPAGTGCVDGTVWPSSASLNSGQNTVFWEGSVANTVPQPGWPIPYYAVGCRVRINGNAEPGQVLEARAEFDWDGGHLELLGRMTVGRQVFLPLAVK